MVSNRDQMSACVRVLSLGGKGKSIALQLVREYRRAVAYQNFSTTSFSRATMHNWERRNDSYHRDEDVLLFLFSFPSKRNDELRRKDWQPPRSLSVVCLLLEVACSSPGRSSKGNELCNTGHIFNLILSPNCMSKCNSFPSFLLP